MTRPCNGGSKTSTLSGGTLSHVLHSVAAGSEASRSYSAVDRSVLDGRGSVTTTAREGGRPPHSLIAPSPLRMMYFWNTKKTTATGMVIASAAAS